MRAEEFDNPKEKFVEMFRKFLPLAMKVIGLQSLPKMIFEKEVESPEQPTFGQYVNDKHILHVGLANRHPNDILRTVAHELVHYKQDTEHKLNDMSGSTGSPEENEANALAGIVMRNFNKRFPEFLKGKPIVSESQLRSRDIENVKFDNDKLDDLKSKYLPDWEMLDHRVLTAKYVAKDHRHAEKFIEFINKVSEKMDHFAEVTQDVAEVTVKTTTFDVKGLTILDFKLASIVDKFAQKNDIEQVRMSGNFGMYENFADGRNPQDKGDSARHGIRKGMTIAQLKKVRSSDSASPRKKQLAHWQINMRQGRKK